MCRIVRHFPLAARRFTAAFIAAMLALAPLAPSLQALSGEAVAMCSLHGKNCTCPDRCAREHGGDHSHEEAPAAPQGPACHNPATGASDSKPDCQMKGCGKEEQAASAIYPPAEQAPADADLPAPPPAYADSYVAAGRVPLEAWLPPPFPPPRS